MPGVITGKHMLYDVSLVVNSVDLSDHVESVELTVTTEELRGDAMGDTQKYNMPGLLAINDIKATFYQDFAAAKVYATLYAAWSVPQTIFNLVGKASSAARSTTNPEWTILVVVKEMPVMKGTHGERHMADVTFGIAGNYSVLTA